MHQMKGEPMNDRNTSMFPFLEGSEKDFPLSKISSLEALGSTSSLKKLLFEEAGAISWPTVFHEILNKSRDLLDIDIRDIMVAAWTKYSLLAKYADRGKYPPDQTFLVPLSEHTVKSEHKPYLEITVGDRPAGRIDFNVTISLTLKGFVVKIQDGKIRGINTGECKGKGTVKCEDILLLEKETSSFQLPGSIDLGEGISVG